MIEAVKKVTHIAPPDSKGEIAGEKWSHEGTTFGPSTWDGNACCLNATNADYATTTEVYPDSPQCTDEICNRAQVAVVTSALDFIMQENPQLFNQN